MASIEEKFAKLGVDNAPGQEVRQKAASAHLVGDVIEGRRVYFSHGDVDAFPPIPGSFEAFQAGFEEGAPQAYTEYRGRGVLREQLAKDLAAFTGAPVEADSELIVTPGTQGALFLAMGCNIGTGDKVAIVEPDYFANRKLVEFFEGELVSVGLDYFHAAPGQAGLDMNRLEEVFRDGVKLFLFSNPNNPTGCVYSYDEICTIAALAKKYNATLIVDELYSRQVYTGVNYTHLAAQKEIPDNLITIIGPSKTESLSGFRLGAAFGTAEVIERMEKLQAIMALRCPGYNQAVFFTWFAEPAGWMEARVAEHQRIRDDIMKVLNAAEGVSARPTDGGSYLFVEIPELEVSLHQFIRIVRELAGVIVTPGTEFGPQFLHQFRINFSQDHDKAVDAMKRLLAVMDRYRKN